MTSNREHANPEVPPLESMISWSVLANISAVGFAIYTVCLPFFATQALPLILVAFLSLVGAIGVAISFNSPRGVFCPIMNLGIGVVIMTPLVAPFSYFYPNIISIGATMMLSFLSTCVWGLSAMGGWNVVRRYYPRTEVS